MKGNLTFHNFSTSNQEHFEETTIFESSTAVHDLGLRLDIFSKVDGYVVGGVYTTIAVLGCILNILTITVISRSIHTSAEVKIQLLNLAIVDLLAALTCPAYSLVYLLQISFPFHLLLCKLARFFAWGLLYTSALWHVAISIERFVVIYFPFKAMGYTRSHKLLVAGLVWFLGFLPQLESLLYADLSAHQGVVSCRSNSPLQASNSSVYEWLVTLKYVLPALTIVIMYAFIAFKMCTRKKVLGASIRSKTVARAFKGKNVQVLKMLAINAIITLITWLPFHMLYPITTAMGADETFTGHDFFVMDSILIGVMLSNCFTAPLVYYLCNAAFRRDVGAFFQQAFGRKEVQAMNRDISVNSGRSTETLTSICNSRADNHADMYQTTENVTPQRPISYISIH